MKTILTLLLSALITLTATYPLFSQTPSQIHYQGLLADEQGKPVNGNRNIAIKLFHVANGGNATYEENIGAVDITNGIYSFAFGAVGNGIAPALTSSEIYLAVFVNGTEQAPRTKILAVPFALKSADAQALVQQVGNLEAETTALGASVQTVAAAFSANLSAVQEQTQSLNATVSGLLAQFKIVELTGTLAFGNSTNSRILEIWNSGFGRLAVSGISYPPGFTGDWTTGIINQGSFQEVNVTFSPTTVQNYSGNISVTSDATSGTGTIAVSGQGARLVSLSGNLDFGNITVNVPHQRNFTIANTGTMDLTVSGISYPAGFNGVHWTGTISPGGSQSLMATITPTAVQSYGGNLSVASNATGGSGLLAMSGIGRAAGPTGSMVTVQGGTLPQASQLAGQSVATFAIGKYEVTWGEWKEVRDWAVANGYSDLGGVGGTYPNGAADNFPVCNVGWHDTVKWSNAKSEKDGLTPVYQVNGATFKRGQADPTVNSVANGYRLPTEAEWEWAARGGASSQGYTYSGSNDVSAVAWYDSNSSYGTRAVGTKAANELAIHDMSGNIYEWCWDITGSGSSLPVLPEPPVVPELPVLPVTPVDPINPGPSPTPITIIPPVTPLVLNPNAPNEVASAPSELLSSASVNINKSITISSTNRRARGGSWSHTADDCAVSYRSSSSNYNIHGFRLARSLGN